MVPPEEFLRSLENQGAVFFTGVPDSLLKNFCTAIEYSINREHHVIAANEGNAIAMAAGFYLSTGKIGVVYMQNSGLGNAINPLTSLTDPDVYRIPLILMIGWRGEPGNFDEPQHKKQGRITKEQLELLNIPFHVLHADSDWASVLQDTFSDLKTTSAPVAILVRQDTFSENTIKIERKKWGFMTREVAIEIILDAIDKGSIVISTTGKTSRELFELRVRRGEILNDFLTVGSMGHTSSIALGVALGNPKKHIVCLDGDGSLIMHMGALSTIGNLKPANLIHFILNNASYESVGGQPTVADGIDFCSLVTACGYNSFKRACNEDDLRSSIKKAIKNVGPAFIEVVVRQGSRKDLGRPTVSPQENKEVFMHAIQG